MTFYSKYSFCYLFAWQTWSHIGPLCFFCILNFCLNHWISICSFKDYLLRDISLTVKFMVLLTRSRHFWLLLCSYFLIALLTTLKCVLIYLFIFYFLCLLECKCHEWRLLFHLFFCMFSLSSQRGSKGPRKHTAVVFEWIYDERKGRMHNMRRPFRSSKIWIWSQGVEKKNSFLQKETHLRPK